MALERSQNNSLPIPIPSFTHYQGGSRAKESRSWLPKFVQASVRPWQVRAIRGSNGRKSKQEGLGALRIFLRGGSQIKIVHSCFGLRCGLAEEHFIVYNFRLMKIPVVESCHLTVVMSEVSRLPQSVVAWASRFWVSS